MKHGGGGGGGLRDMKILIPGTMIIRQQQDIWQRVNPERRAYLLNQSTIRGSVQLQCPLCPTSIESDPKSK